MLIFIKIFSATFHVGVKLTGAMLNDEQALQQSLNEAGQVAVKPMLEQFDTNGEPIRINGIKHTVRDRLLHRKSCEN